MAAPPSKTEVTCDDARSARFALARPEGAGADDRPLSVDHDGRLRGGRDRRILGRPSSSSSGSSRRAGRIWSSPAWSRPSVRSSIWRSRTSRSRTSVAGRSSRGSTRTGSTRCSGFRFTGDVWAVPEGTVVFAGEPLVRVEATLAQAQLVETILLSSLGYPTLVASKAARIVEAAEGRGVVDFGARRGHGPHVGVPQRSSFLSGRFLGDEPSSRPRGGWASRPSARWPMPGSRRSRTRRRRLKPSPGCSRRRRPCWLTPMTPTTEFGSPPQSSRRSRRSGSIAATSSPSRNRPGRSSMSSDRPGVKILVSNDLDECKIADLLREGAPIDAFGVGTELITSRDAPAISMVYKLVELDGVGRIKRSAGKRTLSAGQANPPLPGRRWPVRLTTVSQRPTSPPTASPCSSRSSVEGRLAKPLPRLDAIRDYCRSQRESLPDRSGARRRGRLTGWNTARPSKQRRSGSG